MIFHFIAFISIFCSSTVFALDYGVNSAAALFASVYFENEISLDLRDEIESSFGSKLDSAREEKAEFVDSLIKGKKSHRFITTTFMTLWSEAMLRFDKPFDDSIEILNNKAQELKEYSNKVLSDNQLDLIFRFYNTNANKNFKVFIYPNNKEPGSFAKSYGNNILLKFNYGYKSSDFCAIMREICHTLYNARSKVIREKAENYFMQHRSPSARAAYFLLDDVLSYAIGGLWIQSIEPKPSDSILKKHPDEKIENLSKSILPTIQGYFKFKRQIDEEFFNKFINQVNLMYPEASLKFDFMLRNISLIVENGIDYPKYQSLLLSKFDIKEVKNKISNYSTIFIGNNLGDKSLERIQDKIPSQDKDFIFITRDDFNKLFVVIKTSDENKIKQAIESLRDMPEIQIGYKKDL